MRLLLSALAAGLAVVLTSCGSTSPGVIYGVANMGGPSPEIREAQIANEQTGPFFVGRRYHVNRTYFWGYLRQPRQSWSSARLVVFNQSQRRAPDTLPQGGPPGARYGYDNNYEYRIWGSYTGASVYEPNSDQFLPEFLLTNYELLDRNPGWLFRPSDHYDQYRLTLHP